MAAAVEVTDLHVEKDEVWFRVATGIGKSGTALVKTIPKKNGRRVVGHSVRFRFDAARIEYAWKRRVSGNGRLDERVIWLDGITVAVSGAVRAHTIPSRPGVTFATKKDAALAVVEDFMASEAWETARAEQVALIAERRREVADHKAAERAENSRARGMHLVVEKDTPDLLQIAYKVAKDSNDSAHWYTRAFAKPAGGGTDTYAVTAQFDGPAREKYHRAVLTRDLGIVWFKYGENRWFIRCPDRPLDGVVCASLRAAVELLFRDAIIEDEYAREYARRAEFDAFVAPLTARRDVVAEAAGEMPMGVVADPNDAYWEEED